MNKPTKPSRRTGFQARSSTECAHRIERARNPVLRVALAFALILPFTSSADAEVDFDNQVKPIFAENCYKCHGAEKQKAKLRLDSPSSIRRGGDSGEPLFIAGKGADSHLIKLVSRIDPDEAMPPDGKGDPLSAAQVTTLRTWIDEGAKMPESEQVKLTTDHWSFQAVSRKGFETKTIDERWARKV